MHPAYSVIIFTVASGAGFGLLALLGLSPFMGFAPEAALFGGAFGWTALTGAFALCVGGLLSSTQHLGRPERAWRAFSQWRSSWLSREGVLAVAALGAGAAFALVSLFGGDSEAASDVVNGARRALGVATALLSIATVFATAMIYAQLKSVQRWHTPLTAACYIAFAGASGAALLLAARALTLGAAPAIGFLMLAAMLAAAWALKLWWWRAGDSEPPLSTPESATGLGGVGSVRLFESPHTGPNYLLREMGYHIARKHREKLRRIALALGGGAPVLASLLAAGGGPGWAAPLSVMIVAALGAGLLVERWLFFAEAEHAVMSYYR